MKYLFFIIILSQFYCASTENEIFKETRSKDLYLLESKDKKEDLRKANELIFQGNEALEKKEWSVAEKFGKDSVKIYPTSNGYFLIGSALLKQANYSSAEEYLKQSYLLEKKSEQPGLTLAYVMTVQGKDREALDIYKEMETKFPKEPFYPFKIGVILKSQKKYSQSYTSLKQAIVKDFPYLNQVYLHLGDCALQLKKYKESNEYYSLAKNLNPSSNEADELKQSVKVAEALEKGNIELANKNYSGAIKYFESARDQSPNTIAPYRFLGKTYLLISENKKAELNFQKLLELSPEDLDAIQSYSTALANQGRYRESIRYLNDKLKKFPESSELWNSLGLMYKSIGNPKKAILSFIKSKELNETYLPPRMNLGNILLEEGKFSEAKKEYIDAKSKGGGEEAQKGVKLSEISIIVNYGDELLRRGKKQEAIKQYSRAMEIDQVPTVYNGFGRVYFIQNNFSDSEKNFKESLRLDPENLSAITGLIRVYNKTNQIEDAKKMETLLSSLPNDKPYLALANARVLEDKNELKQAEILYKQVLQKFPEFEPAKFKLGVLYYKMALVENEKENFDSAITYLDLAKENNPEISELKSAYKTIRENKEFSNVVPIIRKANSLYSRKKFKDALIEYKKAYSIQNRINILIRIADCETALGEKEKAVNTLKNALTTNKEDALLIKEALGAHYLKVGDSVRSENIFKEILSEDPESYYANYQLGVIKLKDKPKESLGFFERAIYLNSEYIPSYIGRGLINYKLGNTNKAVEDFQFAIQNDSELEIAPLNLGILYLNRSDEKTAEKIFRDIVAKYPYFSDPHFHLSQIYSKQNEQKQALAEIKKAIRLERKPAYIDYYLKLLETNGLTDDEEGLAKSLQLELVEKHPDSKYATIWKEKLIQEEGEEFFIQGFKLNGSPVSKPIVINEKIIVNYGKSIEAIDLNSKSKLWRAETKADLLSAYTRLYSISKESLEQIDLSTGTKNWTLTIGLNSIEQIETKRNLLFSGQENGKRILFQFSGLGKLLKKIELGNSKWVVTGSGNVVLVNSEKDRLKLIFLDENLNQLKKEILVELSKTPILLSSNDTSLLIITDENVLEVSIEGKVEKVFSFEEKITKAIELSTSILLISKEKIAEFDPNLKLVYNEREMDPSELFTGNSEIQLFVTKENKILLKDKNGKLISNRKLDNLKPNENKIYSVNYN
ncbi:MAG: tetratricopeptide repeat protein [Leptospiraceae bacterium]|nr:tetratricopeptide repeat protein [Leptospiraceae bacterium]